MERYEAYKDSGVEWIGEIPKGWDSVQLGKVCNTRNGLDYGSEDTCDQYDENAVLVIRSGNVLSGRLVFDDCVYINKDIPEELMIRKGDIVIVRTNGSKELVGKSALVTDNGIGTLGAFMLLCRSRHGKFINWLFQSSMLTYYMGAFSTSTVNQLSNGTLKSLHVPWPPLDEQQAIADFLDAKTAEIDGLVADCEREVELLQEYRKAVVSEAVTKGLNPHAPMKDSGIEWIGEIPEGWKTARMKQVCTKITDGSHFSPNAVDAGFPYITATNIRGRGLDYSSAKNLSSCSLEAAAVRRPATS